MQINIKFLSNVAPETVAAVHALAADISACQSCKFYRNEAVPPEGTFGPPYGLLQVISPIVRDQSVQGSLRSPSRMHLPAQCKCSCVSAHPHMLMHTRMLCQGGDCCLNVWDTQSYPFVAMYCEGGCNTSGLWAIWGSDCFPLASYPS